MTLWWKWGNWKQSLQPNNEKWDMAQREAAEKFWGLLLASDKNPTSTSLSRKGGLLAEFSESSQN